MSSQQSRSSESKLWDKDAVTALIDAYHDESGLYVVSSPNYHNKHLRAEALTRVCVAVRTVRAETTEKECATKFHNIRNQFNIENAKVKASVKSGIGTENIYKPSLWYFDALKFLEEHVIPRKNITTKLPRFRKTVPLTQRDETCGQSAEFSQPIIAQGSSVGDGILNVYVREASEMGDQDETQYSETTNAIAGPSSRGGPIVHQSSVSSTPSSSTATLISSPSPSPPENTSGLSRGPPTLTCGRNSKRRKALSDDAYLGAIESIANSLREPITMPVANSIPSDTVDTCLAFVGSILKEFRSEELKLEVMNTIVQTVINVRTTELERANRK